MILQKVLVVDDSAEVAECICRLLNVRKIECVDARSGEEALQKFTLDFDMVMLDFLIPDMNGLEIAKRMHIECINNGWRYPLFLLFSGVHIDKYSPEIKEAGIDLIFQKPLNIKLILERILKL